MHARACTHACKQAQMQAGACVQIHAHITLYYLTLHHMISNYITLHYITLHCMHACITLYALHACMHAYITFHALHACMHDTCGIHRAVCEGTWDAFNVCAYTHALHTCMHASVACLAQASSMRWSSYIHDEWALFVIHSWRVTTVRQTLMKVRQRTFHVSSHIDERKLIVRWTSKCKCDENVLRYNYQPDW